MPATLKAMTALGAMLAMAWATTSPADIAPFLRPSSACCTGVWVMGDVSSGDQEGSQCLAAGQGFQREGGFVEGGAAADQLVEPEQAVHVAVDQRRDVDRRADAAVVRAEDAL